MAVRVDKARVAANLRRLRTSPKIVQDVAAFLFREANLIITAAKKITPVNFGNLKSTGVADIPDISRHNISVRLGFGGTAGPKGFPNPEKIQGDNVGYAAIVHENARKVTFKSGQDHYLSTPFNEKIGDIQLRLGIKINAAMRRVTRR